MKIFRLFRSGPRRLSRGGFTLAEVMIAMGIVASVMVAIMGLLPLAIRAVAEASNLTISARIAQDVVNNVQMSEWRHIEEDYKNKVFYYDHEGFRIRDDNKKETPIFEARVMFPEEELRIGDVPYRNNILRRLLVDVEFTPGGRRMKERERNVMRFNFYVANQNKINDTGNR